jgi:hypothetical protein
MNALTTFLVAGIFAVSTAACAGEKKEEQKKEVAAEVKKAPEVKTVCLDVQGKDGKPVIDPKTKKPKQNCTKVKVRQKFEGTKIEDAKKK